ncbi:MAG: DUF1549 and DUF1553 domain-containing protein [Pirellulales bacterium]
MQTLSSNIRLAAPAIMLWLLSAAAGAGEHGGERPVTFTNDVMAVLSKAGCNMGVCHGNQNGKGGFKLSLRGQDPKLDFATLTRGQLGRRIDRLMPDQSLMLLKPTAGVAHQGGKRFEPGSLEYEIVRRWIAGGSPADPPATPKLVRIEASPAELVLIEPADSVQLSVQAWFDDGSRRDVTRLAVYEAANPIVSIEAAGLVHGLGSGQTTILVRYLDQQVPVRLAFVPARPGFVWSDPPPKNYIDEHVFARLRGLRMNPSELAGDSEFVRRAYLDTLGITPAADEARAFLADERPDKRARLIDELVERPEFADWWALKWSDLLRNEEKVLDHKGVQAFHNWIRAGIEQDKPLDRFVQELVAARGSTYTSPAANFYRANRDPIARAEAAAQLFLGLRLQCAKCHNHPFDRWTQDDYYGWAGFFARVQYKIIENRRRDENDGHEFDGEQVVWMADRGEVADPRTGRDAAPAFLGSATPQAPHDMDRLEQLAEWISGDNRFFAQAQANRIWYHLLGRGIVEPIDDFRATNPPVNPPLLAALTDDFAAHGFSLKHLVRTIMQSRTYQLSAMPNETNAADEDNFSRAIVVRLSAEQLLDCLHLAAGVPPKFSGYPSGLRAGQLPGVGVERRRRREETPASEKFLVLFGKPPRLLTCECERSAETTLKQTFQLISGPTINDLLTRPGNRIERLLADGRSAAGMVDELYFAALSRPPSAEELPAMVEYVERADDRRQALEDVLWGLLNSKEFLLRR